jgi:hypothetical protein
MRDGQSTQYLLPAGVLALGIIIGGYLLGDGLTRARMAERSVTMRGLAEGEGAEQFAKDSGDSVGAVASASPLQKVRVVTTIDFYLE